MLKIHGIFNDSELAEQSTHTVRPEYDVLSENSDYRLYWYMNDGEPPVRARLNAPLFDISQEDLTLVREYNCSLFSLDDEEHLHLFRCVKNRILSGWYVEVKEEYKWDTSGVQVWLAWIQQYYEFTGKAT